MNVVLRSHGIWHIGASVSFSQKKEKLYVGIFFIGIAWFIPTVYVPLLLVNYVVVFWFLLRVVPSAVKIAPALRA